MSKDLNGRIEENKSDADIEHIDTTRPAASDTSFTVVGLWDIAFVHAFACTFSALEDPAIHACPNFQPEDLEEALMAATKSELVDQLLCSFTSNAANRKKPYDPVTIRRGLLELMSTKVKASQFVFNFNPMAGNIDFDTLEPILKIEILRSLVEWQLEDCNAIRSVIEKYSRGNRYQENNPIDISPIGMDSKKRIYWQFGDSARLWREKQGVKTAERSQWEIAANTLEELKRFADSIAETKSRIEKQLYLSLTDRIIPYIEDSIAVREKAERRKRTKERTMEIQFSNDPRTLRSSTRKPVRYRYDDMYDEQFEDDDYEGMEEDEVAPMKAGTRSSRRIAQRDTSPQRTRSSSRLRSDNNDSLEESPSEHSFVGVEEVVETGQNVSSTIIPLEIKAE